MSNRVNQVGFESLDQEQANSRINQLAFESLARATSNTRLNQIGAEILIPNVTSGYQSPSTTIPLLWLRNDYGLYKDGAGTIAAVNTNDPIALWEDYSGHFNHVQQTALSNQPKLTLNLLNANGGITFGGTNSTVLNTISTLTHNIGTGNFILFTVHQPSASSVNNSLTSIGAQSPGFYVHNNILDFFSTTDHFSSGTVSFNTGYLTEFVRNTGTVQFYNSLSGLTPTVDPSNYNITTSFSNNTLYVGNDSTTNSYKGTIFEVILYSGGISNTEKSQVENYLINKYWSNSPSPTPTPTSSKHVVKYQTVGKIGKPTYILNITTNKKVIKIFQ